MVVMHDPATDKRYHAEGVYREITPPGRLVYTHYWLTDETPVETLITVELHEEGEATRVVMVHEGFVAEASRNGHREGWASCFNRLAALGALSDATLAEGMTDPFGNACTRAELLNLLAIHQCYHAGQLGMARRAAGLKGAILAPGQTAPL